MINLLPLSGKDESPTVCHCGKVSRPFRSLSAVPVSVPTGQLFLTGNRCQTYPAVVYDLNANINKLWRFCFECLEDRNLLKHLFIQSINVQYVNNGWVRFIARVVFGLGWAHPHESSLMSSSNPRLRSRSRNLR
jgi:hypothetical protein